MNQTNIIYCDIRVLVSLITNCLQEFTVFTSSIHTRVTRIL
jgi:hypothetical protein